MSHARKVVQSNNVSPQSLNPFAFPLDSEKPQEITLSCGRVVYTLTSRQRALSAAMAANLSTDNPTNE